MTAFKPHKPLSKAETRRLGDFLASAGNTGNAMTLDAIDGLFACLVCSPEVVAPSQWMPMIWGGQDPEYRNINEAREIMDLLMRKWNRVADTIHAGTYRPLIGVYEASDDDEQNFAINWANGFINGMGLQEHYWWDTEDHELCQMLLPIVMLAKEGKGEPEDLLADDVRDDLIGLLPTVVIDLRQYWLEKVPPGTLHQDGIGGPIPMRSAPAKRKPAPGRNDPCPCGSGKKHKKCCGLPAAANDAGKEKLH
jgi:uncharacterized protein